MRTRAIVVGTDGTESSTAAVVWAAEEARRRRRPLRIVHTYDWEWHESRFDIGNEYLDVCRQLADAVVSAETRQAHMAAANLEIQAEVISGHADARLLEVAQFAELMVLGSRGRGGFAGLLLGSVSERVATHAPCPVVVVRGHNAAEAHGRVVVGVDDTPNADLVLEAAFDAAAARSAGLLALRSYMPAIPLWLAGLAAVEVDLPEQDVAQGVRLDEVLDPWREKYPEVPVGVVLTQGSVAAALVAASRTAQLVVVGSRGRGVVAGTLLGSTGLQLLHHADCPVYLVRQR
jgi:nucleotide-binding universal stress UspA family protein